MVVVRKGLPRWFEVPVALFGLVVFSPVLICVAVLVRIFSTGPVIFRQQRVGRNGRPYTLFKFRTMRVDGGGACVTADGDSRITTVGRLLRKTKLDELPELWNVLRGDMSFVGPRPEVPGLVNQEDPLWQEVLAARPGITDPVTLSLRNEEDLLAAAGTDPETYYRDILQPFKLRGYKEYLCFRTPWRDLLIIAKTLLAVILPFTTRTPSSEEIRGFPENDE